MSVFNFCIVCDDVRLEASNKAIIIGFYGMLPYAEIRVAHPSAPIPQIAFLLISGLPFKKGAYEIYISLEDPQGNVLPTPDPPPIKQEIEDGPFNAIIYLQPMPLNGVGPYTVTAMVNGKPDFTGKLTISQAPPD